MSIERRPSLRKRKTVSELHAEFRGLYLRVARQAGVDQSYVSRVARGQRKSPLVEELLRSEVKRILQGFV
jgi:transcriptional regulator with XRE-family HTH domain